MNDDYVMTAKSSINHPLRKKIGIFPIADDAWVDVGQWNEYREAAAKLEK